MKTDHSPRAPETDLMEQYHKVKAQYQDALLFFRMGDFYEMFYDDAAIGARELDIVLTARPQGKQRERVPLCGIPHHRLEFYLTRLIEKGYKVAICEQLEGPQRGKKVIARDVVRVVTPGTLFEVGGKERTIAALLPIRDRLGVAFLELATGEFLVAETTWSDLPALLTTHQPHEVLLPTGASFDARTFSGAFVTERSPDTFATKKALEVLRASFGQEVVASLSQADRHALGAAGALLGYVQETQRDFLPHLKAPQPYHSEEFMWLDARTQRNLELVETLLEGDEAGSLFKVLDTTQTRMGKRRLRTWLLHPLLNVAAIHDRQEAIATLVTQSRPRADLRQLLSTILDLERLTSRITSAIATPRDLAALRSSLAPLRQVRALLEPTASSLLHSLWERLDALDDVGAEIQRVLLEEPRAVAKEGGLIRAGVSAELDELRALQTDGSTWLAKLEEQERKRTGIPNLRVGFNHVFGYYLEVTKSYLSLVPKTYTRRQTLVNAERFVTEKLRRFEEKQLSATDRGRLLEYNLFMHLRDHVAAQASRVRQTAEVLGIVDALGALAEVAAKHGWKRPIVDESSRIHVTEGRHPVVEAVSGTFVPNDLSLDDHTPFLLLTGPNAAGKSTYARQAALLVILARMGSFLPVEQAIIGVVDRIFTRVGAVDFLARGLSTFMVEMQETATILRHATARSLVILDEVGRGTGTSDGQAIAQAVAELLARDVKAKTIFTTHYHELARLADSIPGIVNARLEVREGEDEVTFLYKVVPGAAQQSYGVYVAQLAGLPPRVIERAKELLAGWEQENNPPSLGPNGHGSRSANAAAAARSVQGQLGPVVLERLTQVDPLHTTPME
ncbi:MAG: DNA mismatch repair protein MutS, partial [Deltaproteobacteria bacterium]|nr:DNA mismatch repair protein MutS [Deltaproteobacteria bacterium]